MNEIIFDGYKRGYLKNYSIAGSPKNAISNHQDDAFTDHMLHVLMRYMKSNIILLDDNPASPCPMLGSVLNKMYRKTGIRELDNLKIYLFDPSQFAANYGFDNLANKHFKHLLNELARKENTLLVIDNIHQMLYDSYEYGGSMSLTLDMSTFNELVKKNGLKFIGRVGSADKVFGEDNKYIQNKWGQYVEFIKIPKALPQKESNNWSIEIDSQWWRIEKHYGIKIEPDAIKTCIQLAEKYIKDGQMPQRAIALLDEAVVRYKIEHRNNESANSKFVLQEEMIKRLVAEKTGILAGKISSSRQGQSDYLEELLSSRIIGQERAAKAVAQAVRTVKSGLKDKKGPDGVFYFLGPSGVGKTEFALTLAELMCGNSSKLLRIDMSELANPGDITRLIGAAPSYVGYDNGGVLTNWAKKNPSSVILLDEFEKAHPRCWDLFLQMFDAGRLTDGQGVSVDFSKTIVIMTSNIGSDCFIERTDKGNIGFAKETNHSLAMDLGSINRIIHSRLTNEFRPEFINRIDEVIIFNPLSVENLIEIARTMIRNMPVKLIVTNEILRYVAENGYNPRFGARHLKRALKRLILDPVANMIAEGMCQKGDIIKACLCNNCLSFFRER